jgi:hypothetical protein
MGRGGRRLLPWVPTRKQMRSTGARQRGAAAGGATPRAAPQNGDHRAEPKAVAALAGLAHDRDDLLHPRRSAGRRPAASMSVVSGMTPPLRSGARPASPDVPLQSSRRRPERAETPASERTTAKADVSLDISSSGRPVVSDRGGRAFCRVRDQCTDGVEWSASRLATAGRECGGPGRPC